MLFAAHVALWRVSLFRKFEVVMPLFGDRIVDFMGYSYANSPPLKQAMHFLSIMQVWAPLCLCLVTACAVFKHVPSMCLTLQTLSSARVF